jgi:hypothetical protein
MNSYQWGFILNAMLSALINAMTGFSYVLAFYMGWKLRGSQQAGDVLRIIKKISRSSKDEKENS